jgi:ubiquinone/menaquinone biosynthesis C-methylase UbiE
MNRLLFRENIREAGNGISEVANLPQGDYDGQAVKYDKLISSPLYNRIMWGNLPKDYAGFCQLAINQHKEGNFADIGCGTLSFSAEVYAKSQVPSIFLCDLSLEMLKIGKERLETRRKDLSPFIFLRSDALDMPFVDKSIQTLLCLGFLHIIENPSRLIKEFRRLLSTNGKLYITSLCTDRKFSARYLNLLHKKGHVAQPMTSSEIVDLIEKSGFQNIKSQVKGGMIYIESSL